MELSPNYLQKFKVKNGSPEKAICNEVYEYFNKEISYPLLMKKCKENGAQAIRECFNETIKGDWNPKKELFMSMILKKHATKFI